ncbi:bifunctional DNA primase/polymerase [Asaia lannensis]|uniref:bifunctional DNA primase/polymerase n=1 Tax=Asaia lannensis TaxID=415421 RepID=UPI003872F019
MTSSLPDDIRRLAQLGWRMYPCSSWPGSKAALVSRKKDGKAPHEAATCDIAQLEDWTDRYRGCGWRVVMRGSGIWALDIDRPGADHANDGFASMASLVEQHGPLPEGPRVRSGGGGLYLFFSWFGERITGESNVIPGIDPRPGHGNQSVTLPPSSHHRTGAPYKWLSAPWDTPLPSAPAWLLEVFKGKPEFTPAPCRPSTERRAHIVLTRARERIVNAASGNANHTLNKEAFIVARHVAAGTISEAEAVSVLFDAARWRKIPNPEAKSTILSGMRGGYQHPMTAEVRAHG